MVNETSEKIYRNVKALCKEKGIKLGDVEQKIGLSVGYLSRRNKKISVECLIDLADVFDLKMDDLIVKDFTTELDRKSAFISLRNSILWMKDFHERYELEKIVKRLMDGAYMGVK